MNENQFNTFMRVVESIDNRLKDIYEIISKTTSEQDNEQLNKIRSEMLKSRMKYRL